MFKKLPHLLIYLFLLIFILQIAGLIVLFLLPQEAQAVKLAQFRPQVTVGEFQKGQTYDADRSTALIGRYIQSIYKYSIGFVGILATVVLMIGGISFIVAGGNAERVGNAKAWMAASLSGLVLALASYLILNTINPNLVNFQITKITAPGAKQYCCSSLKGSFSGFFSEDGNTQTYTCTPPDTKTANEYGEITPYDPNLEICVYYENKYIKSNYVWCEYTEPDPYFIEASAIISKCDKQITELCRTKNGSICQNGCSRNRCK